MKHTRAASIGFSPSNRAVQIEPREPWLAEILDLFPELFEPRPAHVLELIVVVDIKPFSGDKPRAEGKR